MTVAASAGQVAAKTETSVGMENSGDVVAPQAGTQKSQSINHLACLWTQIFCAQPLGFSEKCPALQTDSVDPISQLIAGEVGFFLYAAPSNACVLALGCDPIHSQQALSNNNEEQQATHTRSLSVSYLESCNHFNSLIGWRHPEGLTL
ncbi:hypothetical protein LAC81_14530 [Ensifer adhaerens]|uniref:hypothetical protein n=1 Tax=Ensifer adhaerens TaxID=106592 RepID=UPI001CBA721A|nr:hypothetical protein [Ensifer adhaerens]MBZ7923005.1 hypothetical protein [Ensifer adhaerens]UAX91599.1 hypothetical protein LAC78_14525 [Ensifer adhaerens]UAX99227.1 hypothetical protein LAC80_14530 [Ensifer adhaerens]UAY06610.1 hypothetical protein LAC81_14530 [Ensifer adhaerens]